MAGDPDILFAWAHLSDLHVGRGGAGDGHDRALVLAALRRDLVAQAQAPGRPPLDAIFVTGDVAWSGAEAEYGEAGRWLAETAEAAGVRKGAVYVVPGNHDVDRSAGGDKNAARLLKDARRGEERIDAALADDGDRALLQKRLEPYLAFAAGFAPGCANLFWRETIEARGDLRIRLVGLNTALLAVDEDDKGKLWLGKAQVTTALLGAGEGELLLVLSHHPLHGGWLADEKDADAWVRNHAHLHLFGHVKDHASEGARSGAAGGFVRIAAGAAHGKDGGHGYSVGAVVRTGGEALAVRVWPRRWSPVNAGFRLDVGAVPERQEYAEHALGLADLGGEIQRQGAKTQSRKKTEKDIFEGPGGVPATAVAHFLGRDAEMGALREALATGAVCVVATGLGGIGKTSLVRQFVATEAAAMFPGGSVWIDAMNLDADVARVCERFGYASDRRPKLAEAARFLAGALHDRRVLVVIDNVWPDKVDVAALPVVAGTSRTVLTSRAPALHELLGHEARPLVLGRWSEEICRAYLREVAPGLGSASDKDLDALAMFVGHLPLAVRLLARLLLRPGTTSARLLVRLNQEPLGTLDKVATGADRGVAATFKASYDALDEGQRVVLRALAACARVTSAGTVGLLATATAPADEEAPRSTATPWIAGVAGTGREEVGEVLADLAERSLVECVDREGGLWTMHDVVRLFVRAQPETRQADEAHLALARAHVEAHRDPLDWQAMEAGMAEVLAAVDRLLGAGDAEGAAGLVGRTHAHLMRRGQYGELVERYEQLAARLPESEALAILLGNAGLCYRRLGDIPKAIEYHQRDLAAYERLGQLDGQARQLGNLGLCYEEQGDIPKAVEHHLRSLDIEEKLGRLEGQAADLGNLGICYRAQGDIPRAIEHHQRALAINEKLGRLEGQANQLGNLGNCYRTEGDIPKAIEHLHRSLAIDEKLGRLEGQAIQLHNLGNCHYDQADLPRALDCFQRALALHRRIGLPEHHPNVRETLDAIADLTAAPS
jgi:tetratricopeptide (TPR) repeat protein